MQGPHVDSVVQDKRLLLGQGHTEGPSVEGAREMFAYLCQYLTSLQAEVCLQPSWQDLSHCINWSWYWYWQHC